MNHAVARLAEEIRVLSDTYRYVLADRDMLIEAPAERATMLVQLRREISETRAGLELLRGALGGQASPTSAA